MIVDNREAVIATFSKDSDELAVALASRCTHLAKAFAPVETGRLRSEIYTNHPEKWTAETISPTEYAKYQEYGTSRQPAHPYMVPAFVQTTSETGFIAKMVYTL